MTEIIEQIRPEYDGEKIFIARDKSTRFTPWAPEITEEERHLRLPADHLADARSILVFGLRFHEEVLRRATRPPAEAVGPYAFQTYITRQLGAVIGARIVKILENHGYQAVMTMDLAGSAGFTANPRGLQEDLFSNRFAAVAAGLGALVRSGHVATPEFGIRQCFVAVVTDAELQSFPLQNNPSLTEHCRTCNDLCIASCPTCAFTDRSIKFTCDGREFEYRKTNAALCDWSKRYALAGESGFKYLGSEVDINPLGSVTAEKLATSLPELDCIKKYRPVVAEPCIINCPYAVNT